jgi:hypothetical protein
MLNHRIPAALVTVAATALATGCGVSNPYDKTQAAASAATTTAATTITAGPTGSPAGAHAPRAASGADEAVRRFAASLINWRFDQLPKQRLALVAQSTGALADEMKQAADQALTEVSRRASNQANTGTVEVVADPKHNGQFYVVTHETAKLGASDEQSAYLVYRATAQKTDHGYKLTTFTAVS